FVGGRGAGMAETFLNVRTLGDSHFGGGGAARGGDEVNDEGAVVAEPFDGSVAAATATTSATAGCETNAVDGNVFDAMGLSGSGGGEPEFDVVRGGVGEGELFAVGSPDRGAELGLGGEGALNVG